jgi:hypothetical protein
MRTVVPPGALAFGSSPAVQEFAKAFTSPKRTVSAHTGSFEGVLAAEVGTHAS